MYQLALNYQTVVGCILLVLCGYKITIIIIIIIIIITMETRAPSIVLKTRKCP